jgi:hypothetical protein
MNAQQENLRDVLGVDRKRIQRIWDRKETIGEQNTKATLIGPVPKVLGWDLHRGN